MHSSLSFTVANESSSESSSLIHPRKASSMFGGGGGGGVGPAKGILKKTNSNPHLATLDSLNVVDIRKYLEDRDDREHLANSRGDGGGDEVEMRAESPTKSIVSERSFAGSEMTTATEPAASGQRMYRALSGQSLPDMEVYQARAQQQKQVSKYFDDIFQKEDLADLTLFIPMLSLPIGVELRPAGRTSGPRDSLATLRRGRRRTSRRRFGRLEQSIRTSTR